MEDKENINSIQTRADGYTKEENKAALLSQIDEIERAYESGEITFKDKSAQIATIRFRLQDKFDIENGKRARRVIQVPIKHDIICPHTNRECTYMPSKEACMEYYGLIDPSQTK